MAMTNTERQARYDAKNRKTYTMKFNLNYDGDIIEKLEQVESVNGYIRQLIREDLARTRTEKRISIDNGHSFISPAEAVAKMPWEQIVNFMDDDIRESVAADIAPCTEAEFLSEYLKRAKEDLIIG